MAHYGFANIKNNNSTRARVRYGTRVQCTALNSNTTVVLEFSGVRYAASPARPAARVSENGNMAGQYSVSATGKSGTKILFDIVRKIDLSISLGDLAQEFVRCLPDPYVVISRLTGRRIVSGTVTLFSIFSWIGPMCYCIATSTDVSTYVIVTKYCDRIPKLVISNTFIFVSVYVLLALLPGYWSFPSFTSDVVHFLYW